MKNVGYIKSLDIIRGFAAISVFVYHIIEILPWKDHPQNFLFSWFQVGGMGVDLFFVLSGLVVTLSGISLYEKHKEKFKRQFMIRRFRRIAPLYYATAFIFIIFCLPTILFIPQLWLHLSTHLVFVHNLMATTHGSINGANWSIGTEMQFYLVMMFLLPYLMKIRPIFIVIFCLAISWIWRVSFFYYVLDAYNGDTFRMFLRTTQLPGLLDEFGVGILIGLYIKKYGTEMLKKYQFAILAATVVICYAMFSIYWENSLYWNDWKMVTFFKTFMAITAAAVVITVISFDSEKLNRLTAPLRYLGTISYGIYLWHLPVIWALQKVEGLAPRRFLFTATILVLMLSSLSWHFFEKKFLTEIKNR